MNQYRTKTPGQNPFYTTPRRTLGGNRKQVRPTGGSVVSTETPITDHAEDWAIFDQSVETVASIHLCDLVYLVIGEWQMPLLIRWQTC